jgi:hypothetical protein
MALPVASSPWYRNVWPWIIIAMLGSAVTGSCISAYLAVHTNDVVLEHADQAN